MDSLLFDNQQSWTGSKDAMNEYFIKYAKELELNLDQFIKDTNSAEVKNRVTEDLREAEQMGVNSTPTFFLNGQKVVVNSYNEFKTLLKNL